MCLCFVCDYAHLFVFGLYASAAACLCAIYFGEYVCLRVGASCTIAPMCARQHAQVWHACNRIHSYLQIQVCSRNLESIAGV